ncbi:MAG: hypothetical protein ACQEQC_02305 [Elusimicrobiota bacterium]
MKKGFVVLVIFAGVYWGYHYTYLAKNDEADSSQKPAAKETENNIPEITRRANINMLETSIEIFKNKENRLPNSLKELVEKDYLDKIPDYGNTKWEYDPQTGKVK